MNILNDI